MCDPAFHVVILSLLITALVGGPNRPVPKSERQPQSSTGTSNVAAAAAAAVTQSTNLYNRLAATLNERGYVFSLS